MGIDALAVPCVTGVFALLPQALKLRTGATNLARHTS
jgi:hypothetical protein